MKLGIVGLPNVGKSTLFNVMTKAGAESANYPFCTIEPNVGIVPVPDERLEVLHKIYNSKKTTPTTIEFFDIAGLIKGASKGEGLGNKFLGHIREVEAIVHVVRCFHDENIVHVNQEIDPLDDINTINTELILADFDVVQKRLAQAKKGLKGDKSLSKKVTIFEKISEELMENKLVKDMDLSDEEIEAIRDLNLLTNKKVIYAINISEKGFQKDSDEYKLASKVEDVAKSENSTAIKICAKMEEELLDMDEEEKQLFLEELGLESGGLDRLVKASYRALDLISYLTAGEPEVRAWTIKDGTKAPQAAGKIHTDFEKGFIRAETIEYDKLVELEGNLGKAREKGLLRSEGKDYVVKDGDVIHFLFNV